MEEALADLYGPPLYLVLVFPTGQLSAWLLMSILPFIGWPYLTVLLSIHESFVGDAEPQGAERPPDAVQ